MDPFRITSDYIIEQDRIRQNIKKIANKRHNNKVFHSSEKGKICDEINRKKKIEKRRFKKYYTLHVLRQLINTFKNNILP